MSISLIIPVYNEGKTLMAFLADLFEQIGGREPIEVIISDGGSNDASRKIAGHFPARVVITSAGRARQMNAAAAVATGDWLVFLHADTVLPDDWKDRINASPQPWGRFDVRLSGKPRLLRLVEWLMNWRSAVTGVATGDQVMFFRREFFHRIGGFPEIPLMEDVAISKAARKKAPPERIREPVVTSSRRWEEKGILRTVLLMWSLRLAYCLGVSPARLHRWYYGK